MGEKPIDLTHQPDGARLGTKKGAVTQVVEAAARGQEDPGSGSAGWLASARRQQEEARLSRCREVDSVRQDAVVRFTAQEEREGSEDMQWEVETVQTAAKTAPGAVADTGAPRAVPRDTPDKPGFATRPSLRSTTTSKFQNTELRSASRELDETVSFAPRNLPFSNRSLSPLMETHDIVESPSGRMTARNSNTTL